MAGRCAGAGEAQSGVVFEAREHRGPSSVKLARDGDTLVRADEEELGDEADEDEWDEDWLPGAGDVRDVGHPPPIPPIRREGPKIGRNDPCPCGSGKKYKKCCMDK